MNIRFETKRLLIRDVLEGDMESLLKIYTEKKNMKYVSNGNYNWSLKQLCDKYDKVNENYIFGFGIFVIQEKSSGKIIGEAGLFDSYNNHLKLELGYIIDFNHWNNGYGFEICSGLIKYAFKHLKAENIIAKMYSENIASVRLSVKCGMQKVKTDITENGKTFFEYEISNPLMNTSIVGG